MVGKSERLPMMTPTRGVSDTEKIASNVPPYRKLGSYYNIVPVRPVRMLGEFSGSLRKLLQIAVVK